MKAVAEIGSRVEMFVDDWLIEQQQGVRLQLARPERRETVLTFENAWEGPLSTYFTVIQEKDMIRLYYRGNCVSDSSEEQVTCYAESRDGIRFEKPNLGLYEFAGSKENNIVFRGVLAHNFAPFRDECPDALPEERYKAIGGIATWELAKENKAFLYGLVSPDGLHWSYKQQEPIMTGGAFDSHNVAFWDKNIHAYHCFNRYFSEELVRGIQSARSGDFIHWGGQTRHQYGAGVPMENFYTNSTIAVPGAEHVYVSFPMRFVPERKKVAAHHETGVSDAVFMSSRDGVHWDRTFMEAWIRPGRDDRNWTDRNLITSWGCVTDDEHFSFYVTENYRWDSLSLSRYTVRKHGFASLCAGYEPGEAVTRLVRFSGSRLLLNYATSAVGAIRVEMLDEAMQVIPGFSMDEMQPLFGDELEGEVRWLSGASLEQLAGKEVRLRIALQDADLYALRFS